MNSHRHGKCCVGENLFYRNFHSVSRRYPLLRWVTSEPGKVKRKKKGRKEERKIRKKNAGIEGKQTVDATDTDDWLSRRRSQRATSSYLRS